MATLRDEMLTSYYLYESDADLEIVRGEDGQTLLRRVPDPEPQGFYAAGEAPTMQELGVTGDPKKVAGAGAATLGGLAGGAFSGLMGLIPDLLELGAGPASKEAAAKVRENYGTEAWRQSFFDFVDTLDVPEPYKFLAKDAAMVGEVTGLPGAAGVAKAVPKAAAKKAAKKAKGDK